MRYAVVATDYDGTLADENVVSEAAIASLERIRASGRKTILATGRRLGDLRAVFPRLDLFDRVVAENGLLLFDPASGAERNLAPPAPPALVEELRRRGVSPIEVGTSIVATRQPHEMEALAAIRSLGLEYEILFNKGAVMLLPAGHHKGSGFLAALRELRISPRSAVAIGDAENDHAFLAVAELAVAVATSPGSLKNEASLISQRAAGGAFVELAERLLASEAELDRAARARRELRLGVADGWGVEFPTFGPVLLICGPSQAGKSTVAHDLLQQLAAYGYQCCVIDPEGDYDGALPGAVALGSSSTAVAPDDVIEALRDPGRSVVCNLLGVNPADRPAFFAVTAGRILHNRELTGAPHWVLVDEAHHMLYATLHPHVEPGMLHSMIFVTVRPEHVSGSILREVTHVLVLGEGQAETLAAFCANAGRPIPRDIPAETTGAPSGLLYDVAPGSVRVLPLGQIERSTPRHARKYAEGDMGADRGFVFRGPNDELDLRARNLSAFVALAFEVGDDVWSYHLLRGDYTGWLRDCVGDSELAAEVDTIARSGEPVDTRQAVADAIGRRYGPPI